jgi:hypothetical protein
MALCGSKYNMEMQITIKRSCRVLSYELKWTREDLSGKLNVYDTDRLYTLHLTVFAPTFATVPIVYTTEFT